MLHLRQVQRRIRVNVSCKTVLLTIDAEHDPLADWRWHVVGRYAQVGAHLPTLHPCQVQRRTGVHVCYKNINKFSNIFYTLFDKNDEYVCKYNSYLLVEATG